MEQLLIHDSSDDTLSLLYTVHHLRAREIGELFGVTEDAILLRMKKLNIPTMARGTKRSDVEVHRTFQVSKRNEVTKTILEDLLLQGMTKADIARKFFTSETTITRRLEKFGIVYEERPLKSLSLDEHSKEALESDYNALTKEQFSAQYGCSSIVWRPYLDGLGIAKKSERQPDPLTREQKVVVLGSMLGDGSVSTGTTFYEYHCKEQEQYLRLKHRILSNVSKEVLPSGDCGGFRFETRSHPYFKEIHPLFYKEGTPGKHIPVSLYKENWDDSILAIWYLDDGTYDHRTDSVSIANKCPDKAQLDELVSFMEARYHFHFQVRGAENAVMGDGSAPTGRTYSVTISKLYHREFFTIVAAFAPPDMLGKVPEGYLPSNKVQALPESSELLYQHPSLYRSRTDEAGRKAVVDSFTDVLVKEGFPYPYQTTKRLDYYLSEYIGVLPSYKTRATMAKSGYQILNHFFPSQYDAHRKGCLSPVEEWRSRNFVTSVAKSVLDSSNTSMRSDVLSAVRRQCRGTVTVQNPSLSAYVYQNYNTNGLVLDTSAGFGPRMLSALCLGLQYHAYEPNPATFSQLQNLGTWLSGHTTGGSSHIWCSGSEERQHGISKYGLAFTSPPYFDFEEYATDGSQSTAKHTILMDWLVNYWGKTMRNATVGLVNGGYFVVNLSPRSGDNIMLYTDKESTDLGLGLQEVVHVRYGGKHNGLIKEEWLLVYRKGFPSKYKSLAEDLRSFREEGKHDTKERKVNKEANRDREKEGGFNKERAKEELIKHVAGGGSYSREALNNAWNSGSYPLSDPTWVIEEAFTKWSTFIDFCGLASNYEVVPIEDQLRDYLSVCALQGRYLSHYSYNQLKADTQNPTKYSSRVKRFMSRVPDLQERVEEFLKLGSDLGQTIQSLSNYFK